MEKKIIGREGHNFFIIVSLYFLQVIWIIKSLKIYLVLQNDIKIKRSLLLMKFHYKMKFRIFLFPPSFTVDAVS